ncbi:MAG: cation diffusion facilitator family transporter [Bacteroidales bacterium]|nr:cation diffusion facilitator family transporter [Bacteroidales bacterium]
MLEETRDRTITRVTLWSAFGNLALSVLKLLAGIFGKSSAMVADAVHSLSDLVTDVIVLVMVRLSSRGRDKDHDFGHGKYEPLATTLISVVLLVVGVELMAGGISKIKLVLDGGTIPVPGTVALVAALVSIAIKELLYQWNYRVGRQVDSSAMMANAWHHRSDALSSIGSAVGIGGAMLLGGKWIVLDPLVACIISIVIIVVAVKMSIPAVRELTDTSLSDEVEDRITVLMESVAGVENVHDLKTRRNGRSYMIAAHLVVDPAMSVKEAHDITVLAEDSLKREFGQDTQVSLHVEPHVDSD